MAKFSITLTSPPRKLPLASGACLCSVVGSTVGLGNVKESTPYQRQPPETVPEGLPARRSEMTEPQTAMTTVKPIDSHSDNNQGEKRPP